MDSENIINTPPEWMTEGEVKQHFVPFLREFYKYRYAIDPNTTRTSLDNQGEGGIIADGKITFLKQDHEDPEKRQFFTCTFEATSREKFDEIKFHPNIGYLIWDAIAFSAAVTTGFYVFSYIFRTNFLYGFGSVGNVGLIIGVGIIAFTVWFFGMKDWRKYRYIFAIEQFKRYFADEQWCAIAGDIFFHPEDTYLQELREQCMFNGFGLAVVEKNGDVRPLVTPSRLGMYGRDRKMIDWLAENQLAQTFSTHFTNIRQRTPDTITQVFRKIWHPIQFYVLNPIKNAIWRVAAKPLGVSTSFYHRFTGSFHSQKLITAVSTLVLGYFLFKTLQHKDLVVADDQYLSEMSEQIRRRGNPENYAGYVLDDRPKPYAIPKQYASEQNLPDDSDDSDVPTIDLSSHSSDDFEEEKTPSAASPSSISDENTTTPLKTTIAPSKTTRPAAHSACSWVQGRKAWVVQDGYFSEKIFANERLQQLQHRGLKPILVPGNCIEKSYSGYFIFWGKTFNTENEAKTQLENYRKTLQRYDLQAVKPAVLRLLK